MMHFFLSRLGHEAGPFKRWHYDSSDGTCKEFEYKGKKGNGNRFLTRQECQASCQPSQVHISYSSKNRAKFKYVLIFQDVCSLPKVQGPCDDQVEMYWYDKSKDECFTFDWGMPIFSYTNPISLVSTHDLCGNYISSGDFYVIHFVCKVDVTGMEIALKLKHFANQLVRDQVQEWLLTVEKRGQVLKDP